jgi:uncharacterized protein (UPF0335 family)
MNTNFKKVMDLLSDIKSAFHKKEASNFTQATLTDGTTVIEYEALEVGVPVFVVADGEMIPAPEGTHSLSGDMEGVSIVVDAAGVITEVIDTRVDLESSDQFDSISAEQLPAVLERITELIAAETGLEMGRAYDIASAVVANINESTETVVEEEVEAEATFSAQDAENMINARLETFTMAVESLVEMTKAIADNNTQINNELSSLKSDFETFKRQPSVETRENEKFSRVGNLTTRQAFLIKNK